MVRKEQMGALLVAGFLAPTARRFPLQYRVRAWFPSTMEALKSAVRRVLRLAGECGCVEDFRVDVEIAVGEALINAIVHGHKSCSQKKILLRCYGSPGQGLLVAVRDQGEGFNPDAVPDPKAADRVLLPHGRGLALMRELMDYVEYQKGGREVIMYKACCPP